MRGSLASQSVIQLPAASPVTLLAQHPGWRLFEERAETRQVLLLAFPVLGEPYSVTRSSAACPG
eukprot:7437237-Pyramimonas_sp.AAC.1